MAITIGEAKKLPSYVRIHDQYMEKLKKIGDALGFDTDSVKTPIGNLDCAWMMKDLSLPKITGNISFAAFEVICSEDQKQLKGSMLNLISSKPAFAVFCLIREEIKKGCKEPDKWLNRIEKFVEKLQKEFGGIARIIIWTEEDVNNLYERIVNQKKT